MKEVVSLKEQLAEYTKKNLLKGYTEDSLRYSLLSQGYGRIAIENAINLANKKLAEQAPKMQEKPQIIYKAIDGNASVKAEPNLFKRIWKKLFGK